MVNEDERKLARKASWLLAGGVAGAVNTTLYLIAFLWVLKDLRLSDLPSSDAKWYFYLLFYTAHSAVTIIAAWLLRRRKEKGLLFLKLSAGLLLLSLIIPVKGIINLFLMTLFFSGAGSVMLAAMLTETPITIVFLLAPFATILFVTTIIVNAASLKKWKKSFKAVS